MTSASLQGLGAALERQGRKRVWLAKQLGVSRMTLWRWESGAEPIPVERQRQIAELLGEPIEAIFGAAA